MEPKRLAAYARLCRKLGITKLTVGDVSFEINLAVEPSSHRSAPKTTPEVDKGPEVDTLTDEEILYWSATGTNI